MVFSRSVQFERETSAFSSSMPSKRLLLVHSLTEYGDAGLGGERAIDGNQCDSDESIAEDPKLERNINKPREWFMIATRWQELSMCFGSESHMCFSASCFSP